MPNQFEFETLLLIGATSGIGEEMARQYHAAGKKVIISGRRIERLNRVKSELPGAEAIQMDIQALDSIPNAIGQAFDQFPSIDAIIIVAGQQNYYNFNSGQPPLVPGKGAPNTSDINSEITTNLTGPIILTREIIKYASSGPRGSKPFTLAYVTSGLAYVPVPIFPIYCASKAALHYFIVSMRAQLVDTKIRLVEIVPPYVQTELDSHHQDVVHAAMGKNTPPGQEVGDYVASVLQGMGKTDEDGKPPTLVAEGFPLIMANAWVNAFGPLAKNFGLKL
ncbi:hypothetical protein CEP51_015525 [Fusarium floridanum]|uniref:NAD(P)-binding protein n=2 Tax=Fusarium solani species complex TaxID=232080 RepID=A0A428P851_9HYPO|nr:hypothetical protein CEP51_015525 [Fusarium floridanum]RSL96350.1 hypothetical protein CDV31_013528 [Fusarium ambrosium]